MAEILFAFVRKLARQLFATGTASMLKPMKLVAFICSANLCRSPMAHAIFAAESKQRGLGIKTVSAGLSADFEGMLAVRTARITCDKYRTPMPHFVATHISKVDLSQAARIFVMEQKHVSFLSSNSSLPPKRICLLGEFDPMQRGLEIADPTGQDLEAVEFCYDRLRDCIINYLETTRDFD